MLNFRMMQFWAFIFFASVRLDCQVQTELGSQGSFLLFVPVSQPS
jgi:hypothetical protein